MQGWRQPQPSGTNRPSSYPSHPRGRSCMCLAGATHLRSIRIRGPLSSLCGPQGTRRGSPSRGRHSHRLETSAAHRSAAMAGGARPDPFRTRKLSRRAPMVLRGQPVGEQGAADRWTALDPYIAGSGAGAPRGTPAAPPFFSPYMDPQGPRGPFPCGEGLRLLAASPGRLFAGRTESSISASGAGRRLPRGAPSPGAVLAGEGALAPSGAGGPRPRARGLRAHAAPDGPPVHGGGAPMSAPLGAVPPGAGDPPASRACPSAVPRPRRPDRAPGRVLRAP